MTAQTIEQPTIAHPPAAAIQRAGKYLTFRLGSEEYGIQVVRVREIMGVLPITPVPGTPPWLKGVINLRGKIIPVVDLRLKFQCHAGEFDKATCIIVVE